MPEDLFSVWLFNITNVPEIRQGAKPKLVRVHACWGQVIPGGLKRASVYIAHSTASRVDT